ncbi:unnamed protein product [Adineta ricciae]|uniref:Uncharacterized protein n=3 Tax=Adineta ricciae TaxID=249248 RepID=A0A813VTR8_ADIRI|nr:unnamed protein product [Adineta ricciae]
MGNCIGKKSDAKNKRRTYVPSPPTIHKRFGKKRSLSLSSPSAAKRPSVLVSHLPDVKESDYLIQKNEECEEQIARCSVYSVGTTVSNDPFILIHSPSTSLSIQLPIECDNVESNHTIIDLAHPVLVITNEQDSTMGQYFSRETEINDDQRVPSFTDEILLDSLDSSPSLSRSTTSLSSLSCNTTPFSSQDKLILSSSSSSADTNPILSSLPYTEQIYLDRCSPSNETFSPNLPVSFPRSHNNLFLNEFHQNILVHSCRTLSSLIDNVSQQQFIRIHRRTKPLLIEHKQFQCVQLQHFQNSPTPPFIFDHEQKFVYMTKYARWNTFHSITSATKDTRRIFSSCDHCLSLLSGSQLNKYIRPFLYANATHHLAQMYFNDIDNNNNTMFGYVSQKNPHSIEQILINNSKLTYSYDLDVDQTSIYFVIRIQSWPEEMRVNFEERPRLWSLNVEKLFDNTCFIRHNDTEYEISTNDKCHACDKLLTSCSSNTTWSYTYAAIESQLVQLMSENQIRFASIVWNYIHGRTQGQISFKIFKHTLFYFFEQYSSDAFLLSDLLNSIRLFLDFLSDCVQRRSIRHYFNSDHNLYNDDAAMNFLSSKITYLDLKNFSVYLLPKSSLYLYQLMYLIEFQTSFLNYFYSAKTNLMQTIIETHEFVVEQLSLGVKTYRRQLDSTSAMKSYRPLTLDRLYRYQEDNVQLILDYLPFLREKEPSLLIHSLWSIFIQYLNSLFDDLFIS